MKRHVQKNSDIEGVLGQGRANNVPSVITVTFNCVETIKIR